MPQPPPQQHLTGRCFPRAQVRVAPAGSGRVASFLERAGDGLVAGGKTGIFSPLIFFLARKPAAK